MELSDLLELDGYGAFSNFITVAEAKAKNKIPENLHDHFPDKCKCGSDMIVTTELQRICCCNPLCYIKQGRSLLHFIKSGGINGLGPVSCEEVFRSFQRIHPDESYISMLLNNFHNIPVYSEYGYSVHAALRETLARPVSLSTMVSSLGLPYIGKDICKVFDKYDTIDNWLLEVTEDFSGSIGRYFSACGINDVSVKFYIKYYLKDIVNVTDLFPNRMSKGHMQIDICITGSVFPNGKHMTRDDFLLHCNSLLTADGKRLFDIKNTSAMHSVNYIVCDNPSGSQKYLVAKRREELEGKKILYTSTEFINLIKGGIEEYDRFIISEQHDSV